MSGFWQLSFELGNRDPSVAEERCFELGATSVTYVDAHDDPVLEPLPGEFRLWPTTRLRVLFAGDAPSLVSALSTGLRRAVKTMHQASHGRPELLIRFGISYVGQSI